MLELKELILKAKKKDEKAMEELLSRFKPLLKSKSRFYSQCGLEYEDVFQQTVLIFVLAVYNYKEKPPVTFAGYIKKKMKWELWLYYQHYLKQRVEISYGLIPKEK